MDFHSILNIAQKKQAINEKKKPAGLNTKFAAPKKEQKTKEKTSEAVKKLLQEKEQEKLNQEKARQQKTKELKKANRFRIPKGENTKHTVKETKDEIKLPEVLLEEVEIHKEDFVKSSSRKRQAHNPGFVQRPVVAPVKDEPPMKDERGNSDKNKSDLADISTKHSSHKHKSFSTSKASSSLASNPSSKHSSKHHKSLTDSSTFSSNHSSSKSSGLKSQASGNSFSIKDKSKAIISSKHSSSKSSGLSSQASGNSSSIKDKSKAINNNGVSKTNSCGKSAQKQKPRTPAPPPMDFGALLKLAEQKHKEVPLIDVIKKPVKKEPETSLLTQEEKDRLGRTKSKSYKEWLQHGTTSTTPESMIKKTTKQRQKNDYTKLKLNPDAVKRKLCSDDRKPEINPKVAKLDLTRKEPNRGCSQISSKVNLKEKFRTKSAESSREISRSSGADPNRNGERFTSKVNLKEKFRTKSAGNSKDSPRPLNQQSIKTKSASKVNIDERYGSKSGVSRPSSVSSNCNRPVQNQSNSEKIRPSKSESGLDRRKAPTMPDRARHAPIGKKERSTSLQYSTTNENVLVCRPAKKEEPTKPANPWDRIYGQIQKNRPMPAKRPLDEDMDSEEEEWSEEDDFIDDDFVDDGPIGADNYSSHLKDLFGYSYKDRFRNFDDRDTNMVSSFAQQMKEEARSTRLGKLEDLEDIRLEEEELQRKKLAKKKR